MYKIIGADQKEYGPITTDQIRQWIAEGRVNANTQVRADGATDWKTLSEFQEFADAFGAGLARPITPLASMAQPGGSESALQAIKGPAIALKITAIIGLVLVALGLVFNVLSLAGVQFNFGMKQMGDPQFQKIFSRMGGGLGIAQDLIGGAVAVTILMGVSKMQKLQNHSFAITASVLAMLPCISPCCLLGLPFGIWALVVLNKPEVKSHFT